MIFPMNGKIAMGPLLVQERTPHQMGFFKTGFATAGTYTLEITGAFPHFTGYPKGKLTDVLQWGDIEWKNFSGAFKDWKGAGFSTSDV